MHVRVHEPRSLRCDREWRRGQRRDAAVARGSRGRLRGRRRGHRRPQRHDGRAGCSSSHGARRRGSRRHRDHGVLVEGRLSFLRSVSRSRRVGPCVRRPARLPDGLRKRGRGDARDGARRPRGRRHPDGQTGADLAGPAGPRPPTLRRPAGRLSRQRRGRDAGGRFRKRLARSQISGTGVVDRDRAGGCRHRHHLPGRGCGALDPGRRCSVTDQYVHALALGLDGQWRRLSDAQRRSTLADFISSVDQSREVKTYAYTMVGLQAGVDLLLWRLAPSLDALEESAAAALRCGMGTWMSVKESFLGLIQPSQYVKKPTPQEQSLFSGERSRYLIVYPFTKSADWYLLDKETRQRVMNEHMKIGHGYPQVRQLLAYSFGLDDQDFVVAYETDDLPAFGELVRAPRSTESRRSTVRDTPILAGIHRRLSELAEIFGA